MRDKARSLFLILALLLWAAPCEAAQPNLFHQLADRAKAEMEKAKGKFSVLLDLPDKEVLPVVREFQKDFPFVAAPAYTRMNRTEEFQRMILEVKSGRLPDYDIGHAQFEAWTQLRDAGVFVKPPFAYKELAKFVPPAWGPLDERAIDNDGYYIAGSALIRIIAYNKNLVPPDKIPQKLEDCLDPAWKGKFLYNSRHVLTALQHDPKTRERFLKWLKGVAENKAVLVRQQTEGLEKIASGEYAMFCGVNYNTTLRMVRDGAPIGIAFPDPYALDFAQRIHVFKWSKSPATGQLFGLWMATKGQPAVEKYMDRGFPWNPNTGAYPLAKGKYAAICGPDCADKTDQYLEEHARILGLPGVK
ncbi:MAG TPA: ABC transporter substrate-binding protein [Candidatus Acidoferrales bacterium]|nr:ABC transporter substrate-binding protein [Candidatus Acidoferrales bacterium]